MPESRIQAAKQKMEAALSHLKTNCASLQIGRAHPSLVENIMVDSYGTKMAIKGLANISVPDSSTVSIQPWDRNLLAAIEKAINESDLGLQARNDGVTIRVPIVKPTEEKRKELTKIVGKFAEEARISVRTARQDAHNDIKKMKEDGGITEDDLFKHDKEVQGLVDQYNKKIEELAEQKEADILKV